MSSDEIDKEFQEFLIGGSAGPNAAVEARIFSKVRRDLNPNAVLVFSKLLGIHFATALLTLSICPQFGFRLFGEGMGLMHYFMSLGEYGCLIACGAFFTGMSVLTAGVFLRGEELRKIRQNRWLELGTLVLLSLGFFVMIDAQVIFGLTIAWFVGAMAGSLGALELTWRFRFNRISV